MKYSCLSTQRFDGNDNYSIISIRSEDMESIRLWRNKQLTILRQNSPLTAHEQQAYFNQVITPSFEQRYPNLILFSFLHQDQCIGYGGLVHIDWYSKRGEVSFLIDPAHEKNYFSAFTHFLTLIHTVAFESLQLHRIFTETYAFRTGHIAILEEMGFVLEGRLRDHIFKDELWHDSLFHGLLPGDPFNAV